MHAYLPIILSPSLPPLPSPRKRLKSNIPLNNNGPKILLDAQIRPTIDIFNHQTLFIGQMQETNESIRRANVGHLLLGVDVLEIIHNVREQQRRSVVGGKGGDAGGRSFRGGRVRRWCYISVVRKEKSQCATRSV